MINWKFVLSVWVALAIPAAIGGAVWAWPKIEKMLAQRAERAQYNKCMSEDLAHVEKVLGRKLSDYERSGEFVRWCSHRAKGGFMDGTYRPLSPSLWKEYYPLANPQISREESLADLCRSANIC